MDKLTLSPSAKKRFDQLDKAAKAAANASFEFLKACLSAMGVDLDDPNEKWNFDGKDSFTRAEDGEAALPPVLDPKLAGKTLPKTRKKAR